jgi:hypothetical protein
MMVAMSSTALRFATAARALDAAARALSLVVPSYRSPPRLAGSSRTLRRRSDGGTTVSVVIRDRPWPAVLADMVEGVIAANELDGARAERARERLWDAVDDVEHRAA